MRIFVTGATGVIGRRVTPLLVSAGHDVTAVARSAERGAMLAKQGARPLQVDLFDPSAVRAGLAGHDTVVNLATHIPPSSKAFLPSSWRENDRIRREVSRNIVDAAFATGASRLIQESFIGVYPDHGDDWLVEQMAPDPAPHARSALEAERQSQRFVDSGGTGVVLRFALFYAHDTSYTIDTVAWARKRVAATFGRHDGFVSSIHLDDAAAAVVSAMKVHAGTYNVGDDEPMRRRAYFDALATALGAPSPWLPPAWAAKLFGSVGETIGRSHRMSNAKFRRASGWLPRYPSVVEGWRSVVAEMSPHPRQGGPSRGMNRSPASHS